MYALPSPYPVEGQCGSMGAYANLGTIVIAGCITVYAAGDMIIHNRRKRAEFYTEQKARYEAAIQTAKSAMQSGTATEAQIEFISRDVAEQARLAALQANKKGIFKSGSEWLFSGLKKEELTENSSNSDIGSEQGAPSGLESTLGQKAADDATDLKDKAKEAFANERERQRTGGPLDRLGTSVENTAEPPKSGGWMSFMTRRS